MRKFFVYLSIFSVALLVFLLVRTKYEFFSQKGTSLASKGSVQMPVKGTRLAPIDSVHVPVTGDFFLLKNGKLIEIEEHPGYQKFLRGRAFWTGGAAMDCMYIIDGPKASFRMAASKGNLVFISKMKIDPVGIQGGDLFKLATTKDGKMRYMVMSGSSATPGAGVPRSEYKTNYESKKTPDGTYKIITKGPLPPGEYAFMWGSTQNASLRVFDFGIDVESQGAQ